MYKAILFSVSLVYSPWRKWWKTGWTWQVNNAVQQGISFNWASKNMLRLYLLFIAVRTFYLARKRRQDDVNNGGNATEVSENNAMFSFRITYRDVNVFNICLHGMCRGPKFLKVDFWKFVLDLQKSNSRDSYIITWTLHHMRNVFGHTHMFLDTVEILTYLLCNCNPSIYIHHGDVKLSLGPPA